MKVLIVNQHTNNFGDDAAGTALVNRLLQVGIEKVELLYCMPGYLPINDNRVIHNHKLNVRKLCRLDFILYWLFGVCRGEFIPNFVRKLADYDLIIVSPCGSNLGIYKDWQLLFQDLIVIKNNRNLIFHLNTIARSGNRLFDGLVQLLCKRCSVYVREKSSQQYLEHVGVTATWGPDSAFMLESRGTVNCDKRRIVFVPSNVWSWHVNFIGDESKSYDEMIIKPLAIFAKKHDKDIYILAHTNSKEEKTFNDETKLKLESIIPGLKVVIPDIETVYDYENYIRSAYFLVGMRYHSIVLAAKSAVPFISLSYEQKMKEVSEYTGQQDFCLDLKDIYQMETFSRLLENICERQSKIRQDLETKKNWLIKGANVVIEEQILRKRF